MRIVKVKINEKLIKVINKFLINLLILIQYISEFVKVMAPEMYKKFFNLNMKQQNINLWKKELFIDASHPNETRVVLKSRQSH